MTGYRPPRKHVVREAVRAALGVGVVNSLSKYAIAAATGFTATQVYTSGLRLIQIEHQQAANDHQLNIIVPGFICRDQIGGTTEHRYFYASSHLEMQKYAWLRARNIDGRERASKRIKQFTVAEWNLPIDHPAYATSRIIADLAWVAERQHRVDRPAFVTTYEALVLPEVQAAAASLAVLRAMIDGGAETQ